MVRIVATRVLSAAASVFSVAEHVMFADVSHTKISHKGKQANACAC